MYVTAYLSLLLCPIVARAYFDLPLFLVPTMFRFKFFCLKGRNFSGWRKKLNLAGINFGRLGKSLYLAGINFGGRQRIVNFQLSGLVEKETKYLNKKRKIHHMDPIFSKNKNNTGF